jgi:large subunit ribosomal protein L24e
MPECSFCHTIYEFPRGTTVVQKDGTIRYYCCSKCRKNSEMGRDNKKLQWIRKMPTEEIKPSETKKV